MPSNESNKEEGWLKVERENTNFPVKWIWEDNPELIGKLVDKSLGVKGKYNFYIFELDGGEQVSVLGTKVLDQYLKDVNIGTIFKINYLGDMELSNGNTMKDFEVHRRE